MADEQHHPRPAAGDEPADAELLRLHVCGDQYAFGTLFTRHRDRLWAVAVRTLGDAEEAADALQDAMISAFRQAAGFRGDAAVTTWLHRIVVNACLDRMRRRAARPVTAALDERTIGVLAARPQPADAETDAETALEVTAALRTLPDEQRAALVLVDMLGYQVADAAQILGVSPGTVKSRCARGRARLLPRLAHLRGQTAGGPPAPARLPAAAPGHDPAALGVAAPALQPDPAAPSAHPAPGGPGAAQLRNQSATGRVSPVEGGERRP